MNQNDFYWAFTPAKVVIYKSIHASNLAGFLARLQKLFPLLLNKFEVWVSCETVCDMFDQFFSLISQNEIQHFARFTEYRIHNLIYIGSFYSGDHLSEKYRFLTFWTRTLHFGWYLIGDDDVWKHFKYWFSSSIKYVIETLKLLPKWLTDKF